MKRYRLIGYKTIIHPEETDRYLLPHKEGELILFSDIDDFMGAVADLLTIKKLPESKLEPIRQALENLYHDEAEV